MKKIHAKLYEVILHVWDFMAINVNNWKWVLNPYISLFIFICRSRNLSKPNQITWNLVRIEITISPICLNNYMKISQIFFCLWVKNIYFLQRSLFVKKCFLQLCNIILYNLLWAQFLLNFQKYGTKMFIWTLTIILFF